MHSSEQQQSDELTYVLLNIAPFPAVGRPFANIIGKVGS